MIDPPSVGGGKCEYNKPTPAIVDYFTWLRYCIPPRSHPLRHSSAFNSIDSNFPESTHTATLWEVGIKPTAALPSF